MIADRGDQSLQFKGPDQLGPIAVAGACVPTLVNTAGTTTIGTRGGLYFGLNCLSTGTSWVATPVDINGTNTTTLAAANTAAALGFQGAPGPAGVGVRFFGNLVLITTGTPGAYNALWD